MTVLVGLIPAAVLFIVSLGAAVISVRWAAIGFTTAVYIALGIIVVSCACLRPPDDPLGSRRVILTVEEEALFKKHYAFFRAPFGTNNFAQFLNFARMFGIVWALISVWQGLYWTAAALIAFYVISTRAIMRLMPMAIFKAGAEKGHDFAVRKLAQAEHIIDNRDLLGF